MKITVINITGNTPKTRNYDPACFLVIPIVSPDAEKKVIFSHCRALGTMQRSDLTAADLLEHLEKMKKQGFTVTEKIIDVEKMLLEVK